MKLRAPAKVNLFLNVLSKRKDGYHEIETLFERISLSDHIELLPLERGIRIRSRSPEIPKGPGNIVWQAASLIKKKFGIKKGILICIDKKIPVAAGLGGGSSDAAAVLMGLNRLWKLKLSCPELMDLGAKLGSDVPFFLLDTSFAMGRGRGELLRKLACPKKKLWHCIIKPSFAISTREAYRRLERVRLTSPIPNVKILIHSIERARLECLDKLLFNRLELTLNKRVREIQRMKDELVRRGAVVALMSGSGSAVFGIFKTKKIASKAAIRIQNTNPRWKAFVASTY